MNPTMGGYIDQLDTDGLDRLITAEDFSDGAWWDGSCGCLVGTAEDIKNRLQPVIIEECVDTSGGWCYVPVTRLDVSYEFMMSVATAHKFSTRWEACTAAHRYPTAVLRFGKERVVRAIKLRVARLLLRDQATAVTACTAEQEVVV